MAAMLAAMLAMTHGGSAGGEQNGLVPIGLMANAISILRRNITVCTWYGMSASTYGDVASQINQAVAAKGGFNFISPLTSTQRRNFPERHPSWEKVALLLELLSSRNWDLVGKRLD